MGPNSTHTGTEPVPCMKGAVRGIAIRDQFAEPPMRSTLDRRATALALALIAVLIACCVFVEIRVAIAEKRRIDLDVVLRAAWAVKVGENPYSVTNERGWHYNLPPLMAILLVPLAECPPDQAPPGKIAILAALAFWNIAGLIALALGVHVLAWAVEQGSTDPAVRARPAGCWRWWVVRALPVAACFPAIGITLNRGQVNLFLASLLCAAAAAAIHSRRLMAGVWLAGAICVKIIPAYLILYPLWARDRRWLIGAILGLAVGLGVIPTMVFGPTRTADYYWDLTRSVMLPGLSLGGDQSRSTELIDLHASNSQSFQVLFDNLLHLGKPAEPTPASSDLRLAHWLVGGMLTLVTLQAGRRWPETACRSVIRFGALAVLMVAVSPASHDHYFCVNLVLIVGLVSAAIDGKVKHLSGRGLALLLVAYATACALPMIPDLRILRDIRLPLLGSLALWLVGIQILLGRAEK